MEKEKRRNEGDGDLISGCLFQGNYFLVTFEFIVSHVTVYIKPMLN